MVEAGDTLTIAHQIIGESGLIRFEADQKVVVREVVTNGGYWSRGCRPPRWIPERVAGVLLENELGLWLPRAFKEKL